MEDCERESFEWEGRECHITNDAQSLRYSDPFPDDDEGQMLGHWETYLKDLPGIHTRLTRGPPLKKS